MKPCARCGTLMTADTLQALCTNCLLSEAEAETVERPTPAAGALPNGAVTRDSSRESAGTTIGNYKLLQQIGEGGFGLVFMAEQDKPVRRRVALKIIKLGMDTKQVIARFEAERQALAMMDHPNIAKILDAGETPTGRPYFVMELVKGLPITQYCDQANLDMRERLELFIDVCRAVQHAHQKGIIHRDLKPSNIMVTLRDDKPVVKVIDFGIAKATEQKLTERTLFTNYGQMIGTPVYMSPEQAVISELDVDTRSDIYSLGVLLYELLVGSPPFDAQTLRQAGFDEMRRIIREQSPQKPSTKLSTMTQDVKLTVATQRKVTPQALSRQLHGDLDWIVLKAIEKDRARRYESASAFAQDIERHLKSEPVVAGAPGTMYRLRKFLQRNKAPIAVATGIAVLLLAATAVSTWQAVRATRAEKTIADTLTQVVAERDAKELARKQAEEISTFLSNAFESPDPARDGRTITVAETLDKASKKLDTGLAAQPGRRAMLQVTLGRTYYSLGLVGPAIALTEKARDYCLAAHGPEHPDTLMVMNNLSAYYTAAGRFPEALELEEKLLPLRRKVSGPEHPDTLMVMNNLAITFRALGRRDEALKLREQVLAIQRRVGAPQFETLQSINNLAVSYVDAGRTGEALKLQEEVLTIRRKVSGPEHIGTLAAMHNLAIIYDIVGRRDEALKLREQVLAIRRKTLGDEHPDTLTSMQNLAASYETAGRRDEAIKLREQALPLFLKVFGAEHPGTLTVMNNLANSYHDAGHGEEALHLREEVLALRRKVSGPEHPDTLMAMNTLATSYRETGRGDDAIKLLEEALPLYRKVLGAKHPDTLTVMGNAAESYRAKGDLAKAQALEQEIAAARAMATQPTTRP